MNEVVVGIIALGLLLVLFGTGIELGFAMAIIGFVGFGFLKGFGGAMNLLGRDIWDVFTNYGYTVFPLFILMGQMGFNAGIAVQAVRFRPQVHRPYPRRARHGHRCRRDGLQGHLRLSAATLGDVRQPSPSRRWTGTAMTRGYRRGSWHRSGRLGSIMPPERRPHHLRHPHRAVHRKAFSCRHHSRPHHRVFFLGIIYGWARINPKLAPSPKVDAGRRGCVPAWRSLWVSLSSSWSSGGSCRASSRPRRPAAVGTFAVFVLAVVQRNMNFKGYIKSLREGLRTAGMLLMLIAGSTILGHFIAVTNIPQHTANWMVACPSTATSSCLHLLDRTSRRLLYRRPRLYDPRHPHLLPGRPEARLRPPLVRHSSPLPS